MRKNIKIAAMTVAMAMMMAITACGSKDNTDKTQEAQTESTEASQAEETQEEESEEETEEETEETEEPSAPEAGSIEAGQFRSASGKYQITLPEGWVIDPDSDGEVAVFYSQDQSDMLEITYIEGGDAEEAREVYPESVEEYKGMVSREQDMEFVRYEVKNGDNGSQTFRYAVRYSNPEDGICYRAVSGSYDAASKKYICGVGTAESQSSEAEVLIETALGTLKLN